MYQVRALGVLGVEENEAGDRLGRDGAGGGSMVR